MKRNYGIKLSVWVILLSGCGQEGPLYLPTNTPPIAVEPSKKTEPKTKKTPPVILKKQHESPPDLINNN
ncbi:MAG: lipoprotein [Methylococcales bacterium]|nr:lipoprotein [Methylococcales bacterium]